MFFWRASVSALAGTAEEDLDFAGVALGLRLVAVPGRLAADLGSRCFSDDDVGHI